MTLRIRRATSSDVPRVAQLHQVAFAGSMGVSLGAFYVRRMLERFIGARHGLGQVCEVEGELAGYVFGAPDVEWPRLNRELIPTTILSVLARPSVILHPAFRAKAMHRVRIVVLGKPPIQSHGERARAQAPDPVYDLVGIGVDPRFRGRGIGQALVASFEAEVMLLGYRSVLLSAYADNLPARRLYESCSWRVLSDDGQVAYYVKTFDAPRESGPQSLEGTP